MEMTKIEYIAIQETTQQVDSSSVKVLSELELALVGGGSGEIVLG